MFYLRALDIGSRPGSVIEKLAVPAINEWRRKTPFLVAAERSWTCDTGRVGVVKLLQPTSTLWPLLPLFTKNKAAAI